MSAALKVLAAGPGASVQDRGRRGHGRYGVSVSGPMDWAAHLTALALAGAGENSPAIEFGPGGLSVEAVDAPVALGVAGGHAAGRWTRGGGRSVLPAPFALTLGPGERLALRPGPGGWGALAARGLDPGPPVLGSHATAVRAGLGPPVPEAGARYPCAPVAGGGPMLALDPLDPLDPLGASPDDDPVLRVLPGPQAHLFAADALAALGGDAEGSASGEPFTVTPARDRMGVRLDGPPLIAPGGHDIVSDGLVEGACQVPGDGHPIVLMADRAPTGGYPKIAVLARADLPRLARLAPGRTLRCRWVGEAEARAATAALVDACRNPRPRRRVPLDPAWLRMHGGWR